MFDFLFQSQFGWNAGRMNQRYECLMGIPRGEYAAKPNLPDLRQWSLFFLLQCFWVLRCDVYYGLLCVDGVAGDEGF